MRTDDVVRASDDAFPSVGGEDDDGCDGRFESAMKVSEAFDVQHVDLIDEQDAGNEFGDAWSEGFQTIKRASNEVRVLIQTEGVRRNRS